ncbi:MAG TPA: hypothetical protein VF170_10370, partial [Planctomycetaceae bacterium]
MENALPVAPPRPGGPLYVAGELQWDRPDLLEGRLRFVLRNGPEVLTAVETDPVVVVAGGTRFRQLLPVPDGVIQYGLSEVEVTFTADDVEFELGAIPVKLPQLGEWMSVVLCAEAAPGAGLGDAERLRDEIALEKALSAEESKGAGDDFGAKTARVILPAAEFPEQPLAYCAFDTLLLPGEGFTRLSGRQLEAVSAWVRAGGAVCVAVDGPLEKKQTEFLDGLFRDTFGGPFVRDDEGRLLEPEGTTQGVFARRAGLGFAVVLFGPIEEFRFDTPAWREAHARLWRLREEYVSDRKKDRPITAAMFRPEPPPASSDPNSAPVYYAQDPLRTDPRFWSVPAPSFGTAVVEALRPSAIRLMPGWAVVLILFGYAALVGPIDYLLLGRLRRRKWTWLTFPAVTVAVTWGVVAAADAFMSDNDHVRAVDIVDLDANGEPVRRTRLDLHFRGSSAPVLHELRRAYFARLDRTHFRSADQYGQWVVVGGAAQFVRQSSTDNDAPTGPYAGTLPSRYVVPQRIGKWTPQVNRTFEIAPEVEAPSINWAKYERGQDASPFSLPGGRTAYVVRIGPGGASGPTGPL